MLILLCLVELLVAVMHSASDTGKFKAGLCTSHLMFYLKGPFSLSVIRIVCLFYCDERRPHAEALCAYFVTIKQTDDYVDCA